PSQTRYVNLYLLSDHSHCKLFKDIGDQRLYMKVLTNGVRATYSGLPHDLRLVLRLVGISCLSEYEQKRIYETSIKDRKLDGNSALWGLKKFASQNQTRFENATVIAMLTAYYFQDQSRTGYSFFAEFCSIGQVALISDPHALYRIQEELAEHILRIDLNISELSASLNRTVQIAARVPLQAAHARKLKPLGMTSYLAGRMPQDCFRPRGQEVSQVTSLPGDVVDLPKLCKAMYSHIEKMEHCFVSLC
ncbi:unnamed protein product, partial [Ixodes persulcatus]